MHQPKCSAWQALDLYRGRTVVHTDLQQHFSGSPIGRHEMGLTLNLDAICGALRAHRNRIGPAVEQHNRPLGDLAADSGKLAIDRRLALTDAAVRECRGKEDHGVWLDKFRRGSEPT